MIWEGSRFPLACFAIALALLFVGDAIDRAYGDKALLVTLFFWMLSALPFAVSFYRMRRRHRLIYGAFELVAACALFYVTMLSIVHRSTDTSISLS